MQPVDGLKLEDLVSSAADGLLKQRRDLITKKIQSIFHKVDALNYDIRKLENDLSKKKKKLASANDKLAKLRAGDWTVLEEDRKDGKQEKEQD